DRSRITLASRRAGSLASRERKRPEVRGSGRLRSRLAFVALGRIAAEQAQASRQAVESGRHPPRQTSAPPPPARQRRPHHPRPPNPPSGDTPPPATATPSSGWKPVTTTPRAAPSAPRARANALTRRR